MMKGFINESGDVAYERGNRVVRFWEYTLTIRV